MRTGAGELIGYMEHSGQSGGKPPAISVAMSVYNGECFLAEAIDSILAQTHRDFEFLILDDGSSDATPDMLRAYAARDNRIRPIIRENRGLIVSLNQLLAEARAPIIARMDADDIAMPERFEKQLRFLAENPDHGVVGSWSTDIGEEGKPWRLHGPDHAVTNDDFQHNIRHGGPLLVHPAVMYRAQVVRQAGGYHAALRHCEDLDLWLRLASITRIANISERLIRYRHYAGQVSKKYTTEQQIGAAIAYEAWRRRNEGKPDPTETATTLPPIDQLDALFGEEGVARRVRQKVTGGILHSPVAMRDEGFEIVIRHVADGGTRRSFWRTVLRLLKWGEASRALRLSTALTMSSQMGAFSIQFAASVILARFFIDPDELGLFTIAFSFVSLLAVLQEFGITRFVAGEKELDDDKVRTAFSVSLSISWCIAVACVALAWPVSHFYAMPELLPLLLVISASYFLVPLAIVPAALIQRNVDFRSNTVIEIGVVLANALVAIALAWASYGALALAWGAFAQQVARAALAQWRAGFMLPIPPRFIGAGPILRFGGGSTFLSALAQTGARMPDLLIGRLLDTVAVGLFARAFGLAAQLQLLVSGALATVFYPAFARLRDRGEVLGPHYERVVACYTAITWPAMAGLAACSFPVISLLYGDRWTGAARPLEWIAISQMLFVALPLNVELSILLGRMRPLVWRCALDTSVSIACLAIGATISLEAAAASRFAYGLAWLAIHLPALHATVGFSGHKLVEHWLQSALATGLAVLPVAVSYLLWAGPREASFLQVLPAAGLGVVLWAIALRQIRHPAYEEMHQIASGLLSRFGWARLIPAPR